MTQKLLSNQYNVKENSTAPKDHRSPSLLVVSFWPAKDVDDEDVSQCVRAFRHSKETLRQRNVQYEVQALLPHGLRVRKEKRSRVALWLQPASTPSFWSDDDNQQRKGQGRIVVFQCQLLINLANKPYDPFHLS